METDDNKKERLQKDLSRRDMLKGAIAGAAAVGISALTTLPPMHRR
jgi:TAT (twin-arginine translocation) pathway signal sequence